MAVFSYFCTVTVALASLAVTVLILRDSRGRLSIELLLLIMGFAAVGLAAVYGYTHPRFGGSFNGSTIPL